MIIFSDNVDTLKSHFSDKIELLSNNLQLDLAIEEVKKSIFTNNDIHLHKYKESFPWDYLFITKNSPTSQFDIINKLLAENFDLPNKLVCLAEQGDGFHGFRNRYWKAEKGNIHLSLFFKPQNPGKNFHTGLLVVAAVAVLKTIDAIPKLNGKAKTKWVNDIVIDNSKVCGIITQSFSSGSNINGAVIGLGLNVLTKPNIEGDIFTPDLSSLLQYSNSRDCKLPDVLNSLLVNLSDGIKLLNNGKYKSLLDMYIERSAILGKKVSIYSDTVNGNVEKIQSGKIVDINDNLELIMENNPNPIKSGRLSMGTHL